MNVPDLDLGSGRADAAADGPPSVGSMTPGHGEALCWLERLEVQRRGLDAARLTLIAAALDQATGAVGAVGAVGVARGGELAYRSLRAEIAAVCQVGEHQAEAEMDLAFQLGHRYPLTFGALRRGEIASRHAGVIVDAGTVIGVDASAETRRRRSGYERDVLRHAVSETPNRLRPIARRLAETWAEHELEQRHREAAAQRRVCVVDREDGMADLIAHLPALEAYAIRDRLTRIARSAQHGARRIPDPSSGPSGGSALGGSAFGGVAFGGVAFAPSSRAGQEDSAPSTRAAGASDDDVGPTRSRAEPPGGRAELAGGDGMGSRTRDQLRADAFTDLLLAADEHTLFAGSAGEAIRAQVQVIVPAGVLPAPVSAGLVSGDRVHDGLVHDGGERRRHGSGPGDTVCELSGYGPIGFGAPYRGGANGAAKIGSEATGTATVATGTIAAEVMAESHRWEIVTAHPRTAEILSVDRYRPSEQMRRLLAIRDRRCRFPGCRVPVQHCDLDHTIDAAYGGHTSTDNLAHLCRGHHTLKHHSDWEATLEPGGVLRWRSPTGREHVDRPPGRQPPGRQPAGLGTRQDDAGRRAGAGSLTDRAEASEPDPSGSAAPAKRIRLEPDPPW